MAIAPQIIWATACLLGFSSALAATLDREACPRPAPGTAVPKPKDLRSIHGVLRTQFALRNSRQSDGSVRYCYVTPDGDQSPTLRLRPGDLLILHLKNELVDLGNGSAPAHQLHRHGSPTASANPCESGVMSLMSTNIHFHGMTVPPVCHQDDVMRTSIQPGDAEFEYRIRVPMEEPPGLYWYHPHIHGFSKAQVMGGASGAIIIEGLEAVERQVAGLPERVLIVRDQNLLNPESPPAASEPTVPRVFIDRDGHSANNGSGFGKPAKDLSVNFVPVPYPDYPPAIIEMRAGEKQLWRVLNASAITYLNLSVIFNRAAQRVGLVAIDGVPLNRNDMCR